MAGMRHSSCRWRGAIIAVFAAALAARSHAAIIAHLHFGSDQANGQPVPAGAVTNITNAISAAVGMFNTWSDYSTSINVYYNSGVPTADGNINGTIRFGAGGQYHSANVAFHEILHVLGAGTHWAWQSNVDLPARRWTGRQGAAMTQRYFPGHALVADYHIFWVDGVATDMTREGVHIMGAIRADLGLSNGNVAVVAGDFNGDGVVNGSDYVRLRSNILSSFPTLTPAQTFSRGDMTTDRRVDHADFAAFREAYLAANGPGAFEAMVAQIPEPSAMALAATLLGAMFAQRRRR